jgi:thioesterase-3
MYSSEKILESTALIRFQDCDPFQHLNNASYIHYFINAREDQVLQHYGLDIYAAAKETGLTWIVAQNQIAYFKPALVMEAVSITSQVIKAAEKSIVVEMRMFNSEKTEIKALLWVTFIHYNVKTNKSQEHSSEFQELFQQILLPVDEVFFEQRVAMIRNK